MRVPDHYQLLGVHPSATMEQIKAAFRRQALKLHPDKNPEDDLEAAELFKQCNDAYTVLSDIKQRTSYDRSMQQLGLGELVGGLVGDLMGKRRKRKLDGRDVHYNVDLPLREAALGVTRRVSFSVMESCSDCGGSGAAPHGTRTCPDCKGQGEIKKRKGLLALPRPCARCGGQGLSIVDPCKGCSGVGTVERPREFMVRLPAGVVTGDVKIIEGQGEPGHGGGRPGDLQIKVKVLDHPLLSRERHDLRLELPVSFVDASLGGRVEVPTFTGRVQMEIPAGTSTGQTFRLRGRGVQRKDHEGDLLVRVVLETPVELSDEQRQQLRQFHSSCGPQNHPRRKAFDETINGESRNLDS